ncbi:MAG: bifunctional phosphopantothenoylcysteine decarboxylase/phosphopantothenate--cysteine ligase CoaBC [Bacteroidales bacterium]|nr:bifunctional phosphopantothenoylcysteine decarboxylase/phosphopantothenate--cysteine ligase CoaBC [Bacteroidales bacterium]
MSLEGKNIILGVSGGIAAYKIPQLIRLFRKEKAHVQVVATHNALQFITLTTLETLSEKPLIVDLFDKSKIRNTEHIEITDWADAMVVAPATANILGKFANGIADDALSTTFLSFSGPVWLAPAMNVKMWNHPVVQKNVLFLREKGYFVIEPTVGELACGYEGKGRMEEPENILHEVSAFFSSSNLLNGKKFLVTAGPTYEKIDPVRFIGNFSSGKMGYAIAEALVEAGAEVTLISGPTNLVPPKRVKFIQVLSANQMYYACLENFPSADGIIMAAAVSDFKPQKVETNKIKKGKQIVLTLEQNPDILQEIGKIKKENQVIVGFALETENELSHAREKLRRKNADLIVLNSLNDEGSGFMVDTNKVTFVFHDHHEELPMMAKKEVARHLVQVVAKLRS